MCKNFLKNLFLAMVSATALGALAWYIVRQLMIHEPIPDSAIQVLGRVLLGS